MQRLIEHPYRQTDDELCEVVTTPLLCGNGGEPLTNRLSGIRVPKFSEETPPLVHFHIVNYVDVIGRLSVWPLERVRRSCEPT